MTPEKWQQLAAFAWTYENYPGRWSPREAHHIRILRQALRKQLGLGDITRQEALTLLEDRPETMEEYPYAY